VKRRITGFNQRPVDVILQAIDKDEQWFAVPLRHAGRSIHETISIIRNHLAGIGD
jgi:hypothetical protein